MARPKGSTKYTEEEAVKLIEDYILDCKDNNKRPYIEELAVMVMDVDDDTVVEYAKLWPKTFFRHYKKVKTLQKLSLLKGSGAMDIFQLKANHSMIETDRKEITGKDGGPVQTEGVIVMPPLDTEAKE